MAHVWISLPQDEDGYPPFEQEQLHTTEVGTDQHRLDATPAFAYGLAVGDILGTQTMPNGEVWTTHVVEQGDHWCSRVVPLNGTEPQDILDVMAHLGGTPQWTDFHLAAVDFDPSVDVDHALAALQGGRESGQWDYDLGVDPRA